MAEEQASVQEQTTEGAATADAEGTTDSNATTETTQAGVTASTTDKLVEGLPKELEAKEKELMRAFHTKTQALAEKERTLAGEAEKYKQDATVLYDLTKQEWFKKAVELEKGRRSGAHQEMSDEDFESIRSDKKAFQNFLANRDKSIAESLKSEFKMEFEKLSKSQQELVTNKEFDTVANVYGDEFKQANDSDALDKYLDKGYDYETSFKLYMQDQGKVARKQDALPEKRKSGAVEKSGMAQVRGGPVVKAKNLTEALDRAFDLARKGQKDYSFSKE